MKMQMGQWAELEARKFLEAKGFQVVAVNYHSRNGEVDLIFEQQQDLIFVEVKARSATAYGHASEVVTLSKQRKLMKTALYFLQKNPQYADFYCRFDVICFDFSQQFAKTVQYHFSSFPYDLQWIENAFTFDLEFINL